MTCYGYKIFAKWGIDLVGPIKAPKRHPHVEYIIVTTTDYLVEWVEEKATLRMMLGLLQSSSLHKYFS